mmetsp:Transcript_30418/g.57038  ORF Transcript_30418/g.57038 Transcript_30418/m.57038 type:complete len:91 (+) Transcript_30418:120-392(+)
MTTLLKLGNFSPKFETFMTEFRATGDVSGDVIKGLAPSIDTLLFPVLVYKDDTSIVMSFMKLSAVPSFLASNVALMDDEEGVKIRGGFVD